MPAIWETLDMEPNDEDELRGRCAWCDWAGPWRELIRQAATDQMEHHESCPNRPDDLVSSAP
jgi:hypothetical protein